MVVTCLEDEAQEPVEQMEESACIQMGRVQEEGQGVPQCHVQEISPQVAKASPQAYVEMVEQFMEAPTPQAVAEVAGIARVDVQALHAAFQEVAIQEV